MSFNMLQDERKEDLLKFLIISFKLVEMQSHESIELQINVAPEPQSCWKVDSLTLFTPPRPWHTHTSSLSRQQGINSDTYQKQRMWKKTNKWMWICFLVIANESWNLIVGRNLKNCISYFSSIFSTLKERTQIPTAGILNVGGCCGRGASVM